ncbi:MAG: glycosyltransferase, partial [Magnetococcales bacterium]|nr:glycosyltransferase [Magnetococcales bacterium]
MGKQLTIVVAALNEENKLEGTLQGILDVARSRLDAFEIIMVNDGSTDRTPDIVAAFAAKCPEMRVVTHATPQGVGSAFLEGIALAQYEWMTLLPGDHAYDVRSLANL